MDQFIEQAGIKPAFLGIGETEHKTFSKDGAGNLVITYQDFDGGVMHWYGEREQTTVIGAATTINRTYTRKRLVRPTSDTKYLSSKGQPSRFFINGLFAFDLWGKDFLVVTEGEKKAFVGCANQIPTIGLQGIHQAVKSNRDAAGQKSPELAEDWAQVMEKMPNLKTIYLLFDGDCREGSPKRKSSFAAAVLNFSEVCQHLGKDCYFAHISEDLPKGLDDLLIEQPDCWESLHDDFYQTNLKSPFIKILQLPAKPKIINSYFHNALTDDEDHPEILQFVTAAFHGGQSKEAELLAKFLKDDWLFNATTSRWQNYKAGKWHNEDSSTTQIYYTISATLERLYKKFKAYLVNTPEDPAKAEKELEKYEKRIIKVQTSGHVSGIERFLQGMLSANELQMDADNHVLNCLNGQLNVKTLEFSKHNPADRLTKQANVNFYPEAGMPEKFLQFLAFVVSDHYEWESDDGDSITQKDLEMIEFLQIWAGLCLTGDSDWQAFLYAYGHGKNGKSTIARILAELLGDYATTMDIEVIMGNQTNSSADYKIARNKGMRLVIGSEISKNYPLNEGKIKDLTGGDEITARHIYGNPITYKPTAKYFFYGNHKLVIKGQDDGIWRRVFMLEFTKQIPDKIRKGLSDVVESFKSEFPQILLWAVEGYQKYLAVGKQINRPEVIEKATAAYKRDNDTLADFIEEELVEVGQAQYTYLDEIWKLYTAFCDLRREDRGFRSSRSFKAALAERGFKVEVYGTQRKNAVIGYLPSHKVPAPVVMNVEKNGTTDPF